MRLFFVNLYSKSKSHINLYIILDEIDCFFNASYCDIIPLLISKLS